jgi:hypothetical protein
VRASPLASWTSFFQGSGSAENGLPKPPWQAGA